MKVFQIPNSIAVYCSIAQYVDSGQVKFRFQESQELCILQFNRVNSCVSYYPILFLCINLFRCMIRHDYYLSIWNWLSIADLQKSNNGYINMLTFYLRSVIWSIIWHWKFVLLIRCWLFHKHTIDDALCNKFRGSVMLIWIAQRYFGEFFGFSHHEKE